MKNVFFPHLWNFVLVFFDDILVYSKKLEPSPHARGKNIEAIG